MRLHLAFTLLLALPALAGCAAPEQSIAGNAVDRLSPTATPAQLTVAALEAPATGEIGVPLTVTARVANAGGVAGEAAVQLFAGSSLVATETASVPAGDTASVALQFVPARGGALALDAAIAGTPAAPATVAIAAPALGKIAWRHDADGCTGQVALDAFFANDGDAVARGVSVRLSVLDFEGRTWDSKVVEAGDVAVGAEGHASATLTVYDRCNVKDAYVFEVRVAPLFGEPAKLRTGTVEL